MIFYVGLHMPSHARHFDNCMISVNRLCKRRSPFVVRNWIMDSGAFTTVYRDGGYRTPPDAYVAEVRRWSSNGNLVAAVSQDWMCEPVVLEKTGLSIADHQRLTIERYCQLAPLIDMTYLMPVLQGYAPAEYALHVRQYGELLAPSAWVGVGSVCKRNASPGRVEAVLREILTVRPDLWLHGFGLKTTALADGRVRAMLSSADSMAWSYAARWEGRDANDWREAARFVTRIVSRPHQLPLWLSSHCLEVSAETGVGDNQPPLCAGMGAGMRMWTRGRAVGPAATSTEQPALPGLA